ncbi:MAG: VIT1/CCC1 transporter family protein [Patescibacteria group bacterium]
MNKKHISAIYLRTFVFGVEDSLVSTVGLLSGVATAEISSKTIFIMGIVLIFVEAVSMAAGSFLSEYSAEEYESQGEVSPRNSLLSGIIMFVSYFISGFIPLFPYMVMNISVAFWISICLSLISLFLLGVLRAKISNLRPLHYGIQMSAIGGIAILVGVIVGNIVRVL